MTVYLPKPRRGTLKKYGYTNVAKMTLKKRRAALRKAVKGEGSLPIRRKLNLVATFNKRTNPKVAAIFRLDAAWLAEIALRKKIKAKKTKK